MKALIFAAGLGTRLRPLTNDKPKALVEVNGKPLLEIVILQLKRYGFTDVVLFSIVWLVVYFRTTELPYNAKNYFPTIPSPLIQVRISLF